MAEDPASLRRRYRTRRRHLSAKIQRRAGDSVAVAVHELTARRRWRTVLAYLDHGGEIATGPSLDALQAAACTIGLPRVDGDELHFHQRPPPGDLRPGPFGILEPDPEAPPLAPATVDVALVPLVAFDDQGTRLGMGRGFYDRYLARHPHIARIGVAHDEQRACRLPRRPWDQPLDAVITPTMVLWSPGRSSADAPLGPHRRQ